MVWNAVYDGLQKFQFLIGWLQTCKRVKAKRSMRKMFQFLIGWLQTSLNSGGFFPNSLVSIPYRLATNSHMLSKFLLHSHVSIPYRLATNHFCPSAYILLLWFQFLIGWLQTSPFTAYIIPSSSLVSIPYRLATNYISDTTTYLDTYSFNSL